MIISTDAEKNIQQNLTPFYDKNIQQTSNRSELPQPDKEHPRKPTVYITLNGK